VSGREDRLVALVALIASSSLNHIQFLTSHPLVAGMPLPPQWMTVKNRRNDSVTPRSGRLCCLFPGTCSKAYAENLSS